MGIEDRLRPDHPLRTIRALTDETLASMERELASLYSGIGRPSIAPQMLLWAMLLQTSYLVRSERQLIERMEFDLLFRWFVGLGANEPVWTPRPSRRTASGCWKATCRRASWRR